MYQIEVKRYLVEYRFPVADGWQVTVDLDAMELGKGLQNPQEKRDVAAICESWFHDHSVTIGAHNLHGRVDLAAHQNGVHHLIEVEGDSSRQKEQAFYSAIGQTLLLMNDDKADTVYGVAVPDAPKWEYQINKLPIHVRRLLRLNLYFVSPTGVRTLAYDGE